MEAASSSSALTSSGGSSPLAGLPRLPSGLGLAALAAALAAFHSSQRTASSASFIHWTTWKGSMTHLALGQRRLTSCLIHLAPSAVTTSMARLCSRVSSSRNRLSTSLPVPSCAQMRQPRSWSTTTVTYLWPFLYDVSSMPMRRTPSNLEAPRAASSSA
jgi:hypothetical protein